MANITLHISGNYSLIGKNSDAIVTKNLGHRSLEFALEDAEYILDNYALDTIDVIDADTDEVIASIEADYDEEPGDYGLEEGFNPYAGTYDWDC